MPFARRASIPVFSNLSSVRVFACALLFVRVLDMNILRFLYSSFVRPIRCRKQSLGITVEPSLTRRNPSALEIHRRHGQSRVLGLEGGPGAGSKFSEKGP